jgi:hypothetical protein
MLHYLYFRKSLWTSRQCSNRHVNHYYDHAASPQVPQIRQHINEEQKISRSRLLIPPAINMRTQNSSPLPPGQRSTIHTLSSFRKKNLPSLQKTEAVKQVTLYQQLSQAISINISNKYH